MSSGLATPTGGRRCTARAPAPGTLSPDELRPTDVLGAFFLLGVGFLAAGAVAGAVHGVTGWGAGRWLALHLALLGGVSQLVLGASQFFVGAFLATEPPPRALVRVQLGLWNGGVVLVAVAVLAGIPVAAEAGAAALLAGLGAYAAGLRAMQRRSLQRARWAARWYYACALLLAPGLVAGALLARGAESVPGNLLAAHLVLNLGGWLGTAIVGTIHTLFPSLTGTRLGLPRLEGVCFGTWVFGIVVLASGALLGVGSLALAGWVALLVAAACLGANVVSSLRRANREIGLPARVIAVGQGLLLLGALLAAASAVLDGGEAPVAAAVRPALAGLLLAGWIGLTVLGSLVHLLSVLLRVRGGRALPQPRPVRDTALALGAGGAILALAAVELARSLGWAADPLVAPIAALVLAAYAGLGVHVARLAVDALRVARPRV